MDIVAVVSAFLNIGKKCVAKIIWNNRKIFYLYVSKHLLTLYG